MRALIGKIRTSLANASASAGALAASAMAWFVALSVGGFALIVAAVYVLAGLGWSMLACGIVLLLFAGFVMRGLANG